jgi:hypothetical protein
MSSVRSRSAPPKLRKKDGHERKGASKIIENRREKRKIENEMGLELSEERRREEKTTK